MTQEILSVKLNEFDGLFTRMHDLIQTSHSFSRERLCEEIRFLNEEYAKNERHVRNSIRQSKAAAETLLDGYNKVEQAIQQAFDTLEEKVLSDKDRENVLEARLLLSEYNTAAPDSIRKIISFLIPPSSNNHSNLEIADFIMSFLPPLLHTARWPYTYSGMGLLYIYGYWIVKRFS